MKTLTLSKDTFDTGAEFVIETNKGRVTCALMRDYGKKGDGIYWALNSGSCIQDSYTDAERAHRAKLNAMPAIVQGELVSIDGAIYKARILGAYSDAAIFDLADNNEGVR